MPEAEVNAIQPHPSERWMCYGLVAFGCLFNLVLLTSAVLSDTPPLNDDILHITVIRETMRAGQISLAQWLDPWVPEFVTGYPVLHAYQPLPFLSVAAISQALPGHVDPAIVYRLSKLLLLALFPWSVFLGFVWLGVSKRASAVAAVVCSLLSTAPSYGFDWLSYTWRGYGLYSQLWGAFFLPLAIGQSARFLRRGGQWFMTVSFVSATLLSHVAYGYMLLVTLGVLFLVFNWPTLRRYLRGKGGTKRQAFVLLQGRGRHFAVLLAACFAVGSFFLISAFWHRHLVNPSVWMPRVQVDSRGATVILKEFLSGQSLDASRWPILSVLLAVGIAYAFFEMRLVLGLFAFWLLLYFGRPTWGGLVDLLPLSHDFHFHRLIGAVDLFAVGLIGIGLDWLLRIAVKYLPKPVRLIPWAPPVAALLAIVVVMSPLWHDRYKWVDLERQWERQNTESFNREGRQLDALWQTLWQFERTAPGRIYAGFSSNWGREFAVGFVPVYGIVPFKELPSLGFLYHTMSFNSDLQVKFNDKKQADYDLFSVGYVIAPPNLRFPAFLQQIGAFGRFVLYRYDLGPATGLSSGGRTSLVRSSLSLRGNRDELYEAMVRFESLLPTADVPVVDLGGSRGIDMKSVWPALSTAPPPGTMHVLSDSTERTEVQVHVAEPAYVYRRDTFHPNWRAMVDGKPAQPVMMLPSYLGVPVSPGDHNVILYYDPAHWRATLFILGLFVWLGLLVKDFFGA